MTLREETAQLEPSQDQDEKIRRKRSRQSQGTACGHRPDPLTFRLHAKVTFSPDFPPFLEASEVGTEKCPRGLATSFGIMSH